MAKIRLQNPGRPVAWLIRAIADTLTFRVINCARYDPHTHAPVIWVFWHNRMFLVPWLFHGLTAGRPGSALTSASGDGGVIADVCAEFGINAVRGSSSRRGTEALRKLAGLVDQGHVIGITPDGPRGPRYQLNVGVIKLAQLTGAPILPVHLRFSRAVKFPTWDRFHLPLPFSEVEIEFGEWHRIPRQLTAAECETGRANLERVMIEGTGEKGTREFVGVQA